MTLALLALAAARAVAVQQPLHAKLPVALAVVVQGLAAELQRFGQTRLVDPVLHQLDRQQTPLRLVAQIHPLAQTAAVVEIARRARPLRQAQGVAAAQREEASAILGNIRLSKQIDLGHRRAPDATSGIGSHYLTLS